jgi:hypothetical protein
MGFTNAEFNGCNGKSGGVPRLGFPGYCLNNAENGVGGAEGVNAYPAALHMGASWNRELAYARGMHMGREFRRKGVNVALGPSLGPLGRSPKGGRYVTDRSFVCSLVTILTMGVETGKDRAMTHISPVCSFTIRQLACKSMLSLISSTSSETSRRRRANTHASCRRQTITLRR